jgi:hypothetical protein
VVVGLVMGLATYARPAARTDLERASNLFRSFREQPTPELARTAGAGLAAALSPNERLQLLYHPWTSYVIVPLFALANADIVITGTCHPHAQLAAEAAEAAASQAAFWPMHDLLLRRQDALQMKDLIGYASELGLDTAAFRDYLTRRSGAARVAEDVDSDRPQRRLRHPHALHQRPPPLRQLRHHRPHRRGPRRQGRRPARPRRPSQTASPLTR